MTYDEALHNYETHCKVIGSSFIYKDDKKPFKVDRVIIAPASFPNVSKEITRQIISNPKLPFFYIEGVVNYDIFLFKNSSSLTLFIRFTDFIEHCQRI